MAVISLIRLIALSTVLAFSVVVLGLGAALTSTTEKFLEGFFEFAALAIATASLTILTLPVMIALEFLRPGAFTSLIVVELSWLSILWVLWLASAADAAQAGSIFFVAGCGDYGDSIVDAACRETAGIQAFSFLSWLILMVYTILLLVLSIIAASRKHSQVWKSTVAEAPFFAPSAAVPPVTSQPVSAQAGSYGPAAVTGGSYGGYPVSHTTGASEGGIGPASVQAGTVHHSV
ncbi:hypothetical protein B0H10DRAFT_385806 [Mycena sp. CBHHK59/15]|nr:hypothetical protein B0H10DRAFT_385806 [Mycena sp. CBHHK59/15]